MVHIASKIEMLFREGRGEEACKLLEDESAYYNINTKQKFRIASILRENNRLDEAIRALSTISEQNMAGVFHLRGNYNLIAGHYDSARSDFEEVIEIEKNSGDIYCTEEAIFMLAYCHVIDNSLDKYHYIGKIDDNSKVFIKNSLLSKNDLIEMSNRKL